MSGKRLAKGSNMKRKWRLKKLKNYPLNQLLICSVFATDSVKSYLICQIH